MTTLQEQVEQHLDRTHGTRVANFRQFQQMLEQVDHASAETSATRVATLSLRFSQVLKDMASLRDPTAYVQAGNVLQAMKPGFNWPIVLEVDKERLESALKSAERWESHRSTLTALYKLMELIAEDDRLAGLVWMGFASMHPVFSTHGLNVFETSAFPALSPGELVPATQLEMAAIGHMTRELRRLVP